MSSTNCIILARDAAVEAQMIGGRPCEHALMKLVTSDEIIRTVLPHMAYYREAFPFHFIWWVQNPDSANCH